MSSPYMAGNNRRYAREIYLIDRGTVGGGLSAAELTRLSG